MFSTFKIRLILVVSCVFLIGVVMVSAAQDCPTLVGTALKTVGDACADTGRNQACYGNIKLLVEPESGAGQLTFRQKGDLVNLADVKSLRLSAMDPTSDTWGVALLRVQANLPDTVPGQNVTFLLFGDVSLDNAQTPKASPGSTLPSFGPMQAFYFRTGVHDAPCDKAPSSGILIQSPKDSRVTLRMNEVDVTLGSTVYLQLTSPTEMSLSVLEGQAVVIAFGKPVVVQAGMRVRIPVDATTLAASDVPSDAEAYVLTDLANMPLSYLPITVEDPTISVTPVPTQEPTPSALTSDLPLDGAWHSITWFDCPGYPLLVSEITYPDVHWAFSADASQFGSDPTQPPHQRVSPGVYTVTTPYGNDGSVTSTYYIHSPTYMTQHMSRTDGCIWDITLTYLGPAITATPTATGS